LAEKRSDLLSRLFMLDEDNAYKPLGAGFCIGALLSALRSPAEDILPAVLGGGIGGTILFGIIWKIANAGRK